MSSTAATWAFWAHRNSFHSRWCTVTRQHPRQVINGSRNGFGWSRLKVVFSTFHLDHPNIYIKKINIVKKLFFI
jgi:hypothetical protein